MASTTANLNFPSLPALAPSWVEVWTSCRGGLHREKLFVHFRRCRKSFCACKPPAPFGKCVIKWWFCHSFFRLPPFQMPEHTGLKCSGSCWVGNRIFRFFSNLYLLPSNNENCLRCTTPSLLWIKMHFGNLPRFLAHLLPQPQSTERLGSLIFPFL